MEMIRMTTSSTQANKGLIREYLAASEAGDLAAMDAMISDDYTCRHTLMTGDEVVIGPEDDRAFFAAPMDVLSEMSHDVHEMVAEDDRVMTRVTIQGVHDGGFFGIDPTNERVAVEEYDYFRIVDDEIVDQRFRMNDLGLLRQLDCDLIIED